MCCREFAPSVLSLKQPKSEIEPTPSRQRVVSSPWKNVLRALFVSYEQNNKALHCVWYRPMHERL